MVTHPVLEDLLAASPHPPTLNTLTCSVEVNEVPVLLQFSSLQEHVHDMILPGVCSQSCDAVCRESGGAGGDMMNTVLLTNTD